MSMYNGQKTKKPTALLAILVFCQRRLFLVLSLLALRYQTIWLIYCFNLFQSLYWIYVTMVKPHTEGIHNRLEQFNELCLIALQYSMVFFIPGGSVDPEDQW